MEIEAKFSFSDEAAFTAWQLRDAIGPFTLGPVSSRDVIDRYLDTDLCDCLDGGYACRIRRQGASFEVTLKSLRDAAAGSEAAVRRREEIELTLTPPAGAQGRATDQELDERQLPLWQQPENWPESEARTLALRLTGGRRLRHLVTIRQQRSERDLLDGERTVALQSLDRVSFGPGEPPLLELEVELMSQGTDQDMAAVVRTLSAEQGFQTDRRSKLGGALASISPRTQRSVLAQDSIFAAHLPEERDGHCARLALRLLDGVTGRDDDGIRELVQSAMMAMAEGRTVRPDDPAGAARDLLAGRAGGAPMDSGPLAAVLQLLTSLHGQGSTDAAGTRAGTARTTSFMERTGDARLERTTTEAALRVTAVIGVALALNASGRQTTRIVAVTSTERRTLLTLTGPDADEGGAAAEEMTGLWQEVFGVELRCQARAADEQAPLGLRFDQAIAGAGRIILGNQYERLQACEAGIRTGDHEAIHDGRVAVRRMRTALYLLGRAYSRRETAPLIDGLKRTGSRLGAVRDLDVLMTRVRRERDQLPDPSALDGLLESWDQRRDQQFRRLLKHLDGSAYRDWNDRLITFVEAGGSGRKGNCRVADILPELVWKRYGAIRSYHHQLDTVPPEELHELRKDAKELRYLLEFFRELMGKNATALIKQVTGIQDELGALHDVIVLRDLIKQDTGVTRRTPGLEQYRLRVLAAIPQHRRDFEALWPALVERDFRRTLAEAVAAV